MNRKLARDFQAWEAGRLSAEEIVARHPSEAAQVRRLTGLFTQMRSLADGPVPDATRGWNEVRSRMAAHISRQPASVWDRLGPRLQRRLAIGMAAALLVVPPVALAAADEGVREGVTDFVLGEIDDLSISLFGDPGQSASGQNAGEPLEVEVGDDGSTTPAAKTPRTNDKDTAPDGSEIDGPAPLSGPNGTSVTNAGGGGTGQLSGQAPNGAAGTDGGSGVAGSDGAGEDGESEDGADASSPDATPSPSPTPTPIEGTAASGNSADSPSAP